MSSLAPAPEPQAPARETRESLEQALARRFPGYRFGALLVLLLITFVFMSAGLTGRWVPFATVVLESLTLLVSLSAARASRRLFVFAFAVVGVGVGASAVVLASGIGHDAAVGYGISAVLVLIAPVAIVRGIARRRVVDQRTIAGAICIYVFIGLLFAFVFASIQDATGRPFFAQVTHGSIADFLYYSFTCLTTVGFGDFTAANGFGRSLSVLDAMVGQLYPVTVVALLVGNLRPARLDAGASAGPAPSTGSPDRAGLPEP